jgi:hypothetical protein
VTGVGVEATLDYGRAGGRRTSDDTPSRRLVNRGASPSLSSSAARLISSASLARVKRATNVPFERQRVRTLGSPTRSKL